MSPLELERGSAATGTLTVVNADGSSTNLANAQIIFYLKHKDDHSIPDEDSYLIRKATVNVSGGGNDQILVTDAAGGVAQIYFEVTDTQNLEVLSYAYRYRVHVQPAGQDNYIVISDKFRLIE